MKQMLLLGLLMAAILPATIVAPYANAQVASHDADFQPVPFNQWIAEGERSQIPWKINLPPARLGFHQRLEAVVEVVVDGKELAKRPASGHLMTYLQITDSNGRTYRDHGKLDLKDV